MIEVTEAPRLDREVQEIEGRAKQFSITTDEEARQGQELLTVVKAKQKEIDEKFAPAIQAAHAAHKAILSLKAQVYRRTEEAEAFLKGLLVKYHDRKEKERLALERKLNEEAKAKAETEALARAIEAEEAGDLDAAEEIIAAPVAVPPVSVESRAPKTVGVLTRKVWKFEIVKGKENLIPREYLIPDEKAIRKHVEGLKARAAAPWLKVWEESQIAARAAGR